MILAPCCRFLLFQYTMMAQICKEKSEPAYVHGGVQNPCYRSIVSNTDTFERLRMRRSAFIRQSLFLIFRRIRRIIWYNKNTFMWMRRRIFIVIPFLRPCSG